jgi:hypothetical protein
MTQFIFYLHKTPDDSGFVKFAKSQTYERAFLITADNQIIGVKNNRMPRKMKKKMKKQGTWRGNFMQGIPLKQIFE